MCLPTRGHKELPAITYKEGIPGKIIVVRISSFVGVLIDFEVAIDGKKPFLFGSGEYTEFTLTQGEHYITLRWIQWGFFVGTQYEDTLRFVVKGSQTIYFLVSPLSWKGAKIRLSNETEAKKHIERSKFVNFEN